MLGVGYRPGCVVLFSRAHPVILSLDGIDVTKIHCVYLPAKRRGPKPGMARERALTTAVSTGGSPRTAAGDNHNSAVTKGSARKQATLGASVKARRSAQLAAAAVAFDSTSVARRPNTLPGNGATRKHAARGSLVLLTAAASTTTADGDYQKNSASRAAGDAVSRRGRATLAGHRTVPHATVATGDGSESLAVRRVSRATGDPVSRQRGASNVETKEFEDAVVPTANDVRIYDSDGAISKPHGTRDFDNLVLLYQDAYRVSGEAHRRVIENSIVQQIQGTSGRFLELRQGRWVIMSDREAMQVTARALNNAVFRAIGL